MHSPPPYISFHHLFFSSCKSPPSWRSRIAWVTELVKGESKVLKEKKLKKQVFKYFNWKGWFFQTRIGILLKIWFAFTVYIKINVPPWFEYSAFYIDQKSLPIDKNCQSMVSNTVWYHGELYSNSSNLYSIIIIMAIIVHIRK